MWEYGGGRTLLNKCAVKNMLGSHVGGRGWGGPEIWLTDRQMFALRGDSMSLGMGGGGVWRVIGTNMPKKQEITNVTYTVKKS